MMIISLLFGILISLLVLILGIENPPRAWAARVIRREWAG